MLTLQRSGEYAVGCDRCMKARKAFLGPDRQEARAAALEAGWHERARGRTMAERADWWCPACAVPQT